MRLLAATVLLLLTLAAGTASAASAAVAPAVDTARWDAAVRGLMDRYGLPGASLSVAVAGKTVLERGYGVADPRTGERVRPDSAFRLASVSKPITAVAVAQAIAKRKLTVGTRPFAGPLAGLRGPGGAAPVDPRLQTITVADLLAHRGGWDLERLGFDPLFHTAAVRTAFGLPGAPTCESTIGFMLAQPLSFAPGTRDSYSNFGYCVLSATVARTMRTSWGAALKQLVLDPLKMRRTTLSADDLSARAPGEVAYTGQGTEATGSRARTRCRSAPPTARRASSAPRPTCSASSSE